MYGRFHQRFRFSVDDTGNRKKKPMRYRLKPISVDRWKGSKMLAWWRNYFASFTSKWKRGLLKIHKWGRGFTLGTNRGSTPRLRCIVLISSQFLCSILNPTQNIFPEFLKPLNIKGQGSSFVSYRLEI